MCNIALINAMCEMDIACSYIYNIEHENPETRKNLRLLCSGTKLFLLPLSLKILRHKKRDTHSLYSDFFINPPPPHTHTGVAPATRPLAWLRCASKSQPSSPEAELNSTNFCKILKILHVRASGAWRHSHPLVNLSLGFLFWHLWTIHIPRTRVNTCTQVCT